MNIWISSPPPLLKHLQIHTSKIINQPIIIYNTHHLKVFHNHSAVGNWSVILIPLLGHVPKTTRLPMTQFYQQQPEKRKKPLRSEKPTNNNKHPTIPAFSHIIHHRRKNAGQVSSLAECCMYAVLYHLTDVLWATRIGIGKKANSRTRQIQKGDLSMPMRIFPCMLQILTWFLGIA